MSSFASYIRLCDVTAAHAYITMTMRKRYIVQLCRQHRLHSETHQTVLVLRLPVDHLHVLNPDEQTGSRHVNRTSDISRGQKTTNHSSRWSQRQLRVSPGLHNVHGHRCCRGNQTANHASTEMTQNIVPEIT